MAPQSGPRPTRRVVLGTGPDGRSRVLHDGPAAVVHDLGGGYAVTELWGSDTVPTPTDGVDQTPERTGVDTDLLTGAVRFRISEFPPRDGSTPFEHSTPTVDFLVVLEGSIRLHLEDGAVDLHEGDTIVQLANVHAWETIRDDVCRLAFVNVGLLPRS